MLKFNNTHSSILLCFLFVFLSGCSSSVRLTEAVNAPDEKWRITSVVVSKVDDNWRVYGRLNSPNIFGLPEGYILVSIISENGTLLEQKKAKYIRIKGNAGPHRRHHFGVALFSVYFESIPEDAKVVAERYIQRESNI